MPLSKIQTVLLDADGVVQAPVRKLAPELGALCRQASNAEKFSTEVFLAEAPCLVGDADFRIVLKDVLARWNISTPLEEVLSLWRLIRPVPETMALVAKLRSLGVRVCLATNQQSVRAEFMANDLGYSAAFDELFFSHELGASKPDAGFFNGVLQELAVDAGSILFIDDQLENVEVAQGLGMHGEVYHLDRGAQELSSMFKRYDLFASE